MNDSNDKTTLDLGLSALLGEQQGKEATAQEKVLDLESAAISDESTPISEYQQLASSSKWQELVALTESQLALSGEALEPKLWWVRAQLETAAIPSAILQAPFEAAVGALQSHPDKDKLVALVSEIEEIFNGEGDTISEINDSATLPSTNIVPPTTRIAKLLSYMVLLVFISGTAWWFLYTKKEALIAAPQFLLDGGVKPPELDPPKIEQISAVTGISALVHDFQKLVEKQPDNIPERVNAAQTTDSTTVIPKPTAKPKETVNTNTPLISEARLPNRSREKRRASEPDAFNPDAGRGPVVAGNERDRTAGEVYQLLIGTRVRSAPSLDASSVGFLEAGDRVMVTGRTGRWLRLLSKAGRPGYIRADDAVPEEGSFTLPED